MFTLTLGSKKTLQIDTCFQQSTDLTTETLVIEAVEVKQDLNYYTELFKEENALKNITVKTDTNNVIGYGDYAKISMISLNLLPNGTKSLRVIIQKEEPT